MKRIRPLQAAEWQNWQKRDREPRSRNLSQRQGEKANRCRVHLIFRRLFGAGVLPPARASPRHRARIAPAAGHALWAAAQAAPLGTRVSLLGDSGVQDKILFHLQALVWESVILLFKLRHLALEFLFWEIWVCKFAYTRYCFTSKL